MTGWKRVRIGAMMWAALLGGLLPVAPAVAGTPERPDVYVDGERLPFDTAPQVYQGRTLVPMRMIFEALGADVRWEADSQTAVAVKDGVTLRLPIGQRDVSRNAQPLLLDVPAQLVNDRTMVPVRFIAEAFGNQVEWDEAAGAVRISGSDAPQVRVIGADPSAVPDGMTAGVQELIRQQDLLKQIEAAVGLTYQGPVWLYLTDSQAGYEQMISRYSYSDADTVAELSDGVTFGSRVVIPMHKQGETSDDSLMVIAHELTHVLLNQNSASMIPSWVNEGLAWQIGLDMAYRDQPAVLRRQEDGLIRDYVLDVVTDGDYQPLISGSEDTIDALRDTYNVQYQDYLAYQFLIERFGQARFTEYLKKYRDGLDAPFTTAFGIAPKAYERLFRAYLDEEVQRTASGVEMTVQVPETFRGEVFLQPQGTGSGAVQELYLQPGRQTIRVFKDGRVEGVASEYAGDREELDRDMVYLIINLPGTIRAQGVRTDSGGLYVTESYGEYFLGQPWMNIAGTDDAVYPELHQVFGIEVLEVKSIH